MRKQETHMERPHVGVLDKGPHSSTVDSTDMCRKKLLTDRSHLRDPGKELPS